MSFTIQVVNETEWTKNPGGRKKEPLPPELIETVRQAYADRKVRAVVLPEDEVNKVVYQLRQAGHEVDCTVTVQKQDVPQPGYVKLLFKAGKRQYRPRKEK